MKCRIVRLMTRLALAMALAFAGPAALVATGRKEPITSSERRAPAVWDMTMAAGRRAAVFGLWATFPAEAIDGLVASDRLFTFLYKESALASPHARRSPGHRAPPSRSAGNTTPPATLDR